MAEYKRFGHAVLIVPYYLRLYCTVRYAHQYYCKVATGGGKYHFLSAGIIILSNTYVT